MYKAVKIKFFVLLVTFFVAPLVNVLATSESSTSSNLETQVTRHYVMLAHTMFSDALITTNQLQQKIVTFIGQPNPANHLAAKQAWIDAHAIYSQTEVFRFGNPNVDDWEGQVNAWPMDEGLVDYVHKNYQYEEGNPHALENIIASDIQINQQLLRDMHEKAGSEANVATGYHAIEFLLWGQDLNDSAQKGGQRSHTDFIQGDDCTNGNCDRRAQYLLAVSKLLQKDIVEMVAQWDPQNGSYTKEYLALPTNEQIRRILFGMGSLSLGELAAERIRVALLANAQEDEQSCFSDTTDVAIYNNALAVRNIYSGYYLASDGREVEGPAVRDLVEAQNSKLYQLLDQQLALTLASSYEISNAAESGEPFDRQILADNKVGNERLQKMIDRLRSQTATIEKISEMLVASN